MLKFKINYNKSHERVIETSISGKYLLTTPQLNKSTAFTSEERHEFGLLGKLPAHIETLDEQVQRAYAQYNSYESPLQKNIYLNNLHDKNQILFYKLVSTYLNELLPIIYTPIVGTAVKQFSREYRQPRGLYITHTNQDQLDEILANRSNPEIDIIVVTDGEGVLGIGDQGIGGMDIPVAKLMVYSLCGGIDPLRTLPIFLDVGTNNQALLDYPMYLGCRHKRIDQDDYDKFIKKFMQKIHEHFPNAFLHWEDLGRSNARRILDQYQDEHCTFNDDIQGTGAVTLAALLSASKMTHTPLIQQRIIIFGAGSAGTGIGDQIIEAMVRLGLTKAEAYNQLWLVDRQGLLVENDSQLTLSQLPYARKTSEIYSDASQLLNIINDVKPTILIGCSAQQGAFNEEIIRAMHAHAKRPIILPLSNPDEKCEARPHDLLNWTNGDALIATGTAFDAVQYEQRVITIAQCNNALIFPGIGLGILATKSRRLSNNMLWVAANKLSDLAAEGALLPTLKNSQDIAKEIALAVAKEAIESGLAQCSKDLDLVKTIHEVFWEPCYPKLCFTEFV